MLVLIGLIVSPVVAIIIAKILNRKFFPIWLCVFCTVGAIAASSLTIVAIAEYGITNGTMLCLIGSILCWISAATL